MENDIRTILDNGKSEEERIDMMIREMCRLTTDLLEYRYTVDHYEGGEGSTVLRDKVNVIKNSMAVLLSDMKIYAEQMDITDEVEKSINKRIKRIANKIKG